MKRELVKHFPANTAGTDYVVGDLHGCVTDFRYLLDLVQFDPAVDRVFAVGDLVDRGPDSMGALRLLREPWFHSVMGNHEQMMVEAMRREYPGAMDAWIINGGSWHRDHAGDELDGLLADVARLPLAIVVGEGAGRFNVVHAEFLGADAELSAGVFDDHIQSRMLWGRELTRNRDLAELTPESPTFVGHTIVDEIGSIGSHTYLDTGAFLPYWLERRGGLTMIDVTTKNFVHTTGAPATPGVQTVKTEG